MQKIGGKNIVPKLVAVIMAIVLWLYVSNEQNPPVEASLTVPIELRNVASSLVVVDAPDSVKIKVRGSRSAITELQAEGTKFFLDMRDYDEGRHNVKVYAQLPAGLELLEISPEKVPVTLDAVISRKLPVDIHLTGTAAAGTSVAKVVANPEQVTIDGPRSLVDSVKKMQLPLDLRNKNADFVVAVTPLALDTDGTEVVGLTVKPDKVNITVSLVRGLNTKTVDIRPIIYGYEKMAPGLVVKGVIAKPEKIDISGDPQVLDKIDYIYTEPVNVAGIAKDTVKEVKLQLTPGVLASQDIVLVQISVGH